MRIGYFRDFKSDLGLNILNIAKAPLPFFFRLLLAVLLITLFPEIVTFLPTPMGR